MRKFSRLLSVVLFMVSLVFVSSPKVFAQGVPCNPYSLDHFSALNGPSINNINTVAVDPTQSLVAFGGAYGNGTLPGTALNTFNSNGYTSAYPVTPIFGFGPLRQGFINVATTNYLQEFLPSVFKLNSSVTSSVQALAFGSNFDFYVAGSSGASAIPINFDIINNGFSSYYGSAGSAFITKYSGVINYQNTVFITSTPALFLPVNQITISEIKASSLGYLYVVGKASLGYFNFDPIGNLLPPVYIPTFEAFVAVYDSNMHIAAFYRFERPGANFSTIALDIDSLGNAAIVGSVDAAFNNTILKVKDANNNLQVSQLGLGGEDGFILRLSPTLAITEFQLLSGSGKDGITDVAFGTSTSINLTGYFSGTTFFDFGVGTSFQTSAGLTDGFIAQYDVSSGPLTLQWVNILGNTGADAGHTIAFSNNNADVIVAGKYFPVGAIIPDIFITKYDYFGTLKFFQGAALNNDAVVKHAYSLISNKLIVVLERAPLVGAPFYTNLFLLNDNCP